MAAFDFAKAKRPHLFQGKRTECSCKFPYLRFPRRISCRRIFALALKLDGIWKFAYAKNYTSAIPGFEKTDYDCSGWDDIHVPAHIQMEGYDIPQYANVQYPWDGREESTAGRDPAAVQSGGKLCKILRAAGIHAGQARPHRVRGCGKRHGSLAERVLCGLHRGQLLRTRIRSDSLSPAGREQTCFAGVQAGLPPAGAKIRTSSAFSGIFRSVWLYAIPTVHLEDLSVKTLFAGDDFTHSTLEVALQVEGKGAARLTLRRSELEVFSEKSH